MKYDAITIDTNIFYNNGYVLNKGLLAQLTQFKEGSIQFILSDVVHGEIYSHILKNNSDEYEKLTSALKNNRRKNLISEEAEKTITDILDKEGDIVLKTKKYVDGFIKNTGCEVIKASRLCSIDKLLRLYFNTKPPFENKKDKKSEFPDAIALISIEKWAEENKKNVLAVSQDKGWKDFIEHSKNISITEDLSKALNDLQQYLNKQSIETKISINEASSKVKRFISDIIINKNVPDLLNELTDRIREAVEYLNLYPDACSGFLFDVDYLNTEFNDFKVIESENYSIIRIEDQIIVAEIPIEVEIVGSAEFNFLVRDSTDRDCISIGYSTVEKEINFRASMLLSLYIGDDSESSPYFEIYEVEIINYDNEINFGEVEPDFSSEDPTYEKY